MLAYLESLRTYSRIGWLEGERERVELRHLVDEALTRLAPQIEASRAEVSVCELPAVICERGQMTLVFESLLSNAIKFSGPNRPRVRGHLRLPPRGGRDRRRRPRHRRRARCRRALVRHARATERPAVPRGMGLAIARKAIERHGGAIWCEPAEPRGSLFRFALPYLQTAR